MGFSSKKGADWRKIKPQPYESFEEAECRREEEAVAVNPPLSRKQKETVRKQAGVNPIEQTVGDALKDIDDVPETERRPDNGKE